MNSVAKVFTVVSGKGGVGKSTFCVNIALSLCKMNKKVLLIDGDISLRSLDLLLGLDENLVYDWSDIICNRCNEETAVLQFNENLHLLPAPLNEPENLDKESFGSVVTTLSPLYDFIFIDSPAGVGKLPQIYAECCDTCIVVATPDNVSARSAFAVSTVLAKSGIIEEKLRLIINRFDEKSVKRGRLLNIDEMIDITCIRLLGVIPEEKTLTYLSVTEKHLSEYTETKIAFNNIARRIQGKEIPLYL